MSEKGDSSGSTEAQPGLLKIQIYPELQSGSAAVATCEPPSPII